MDLNNGRFVITVPNEKAFLSSTYASRTIRRWAGQEKIMPKNKKKRTRNKWQLSIEVPKRCWGLDEGLEACGGKTCERTGPGKCQKVDYYLKINGLVSVAKRGVWNIHKYVDLDLSEIHRDKLSREKVVAFL